MKLATLKDGSRDGRLVVVSQHGETALPAPVGWPTMQRALDDWDNAAPALQDTSDKLNRDVGSGLPLDLTLLGAPLPRAYEWLDASAFLNHVRLVRQARGAALPATLHTEPLIYQGGGSDLLGPAEPFLLADEAWGLDFEGELCAILGDVPQGVDAQAALQSVRLLTIVNDWTLRHLVSDELAKGFGFVQAKPATTFGPFAVTPDELGDAWKDGRAHIELRCTYNGQVVGHTLAGPEMHFSFGDLIAHVAKTRRLGAGTLLGSGTISNVEPGRGFSCLVEQRAREVLAHGKAVTPFMAVGDRIRIEALVPETLDSPFGAIEQTVVAGRRPAAP